jgi:hypothetical protein
MKAGDIRLAVSAILVSVGFVFFLAAIWTHGHDTVTRVAGTGGVLFAIGAVMGFIELMHRIDL